MEPSESEQARRPRRPLLSRVVLRAQTDERLVALAAEGHRAAFEVIFDRYRLELCAHARRIVRTDLADDVFQQTMLGAWSALRAGRVPSGDIRAWLHRITHNAALNVVARRGYSLAALSEEVRADAADLAEVRLEAQQALAAVASLPKRQRDAIALTAIQGRSGHDAAAALGVSEPALRQLVSRARSRMRAALSAITPLPLLEWASAAAQPGTPGVVELGTSAGLIVTATKVAATVGLTGVMLGGAHQLLQHHGHSRHRAAGAMAIGAAAPATALAGGAASVIPATQESAGRSASPQPAETSAQRTGDRRRGRAQRGEFSPRSPTRGGHDGGQHGTAQRTDGGGGRDSRRGGTQSAAPARLESADSGSSRDGTSGSSNRASSTSTSGDGSGGSSDGSTTQTQTTTTDQPSSATQTSTSDQSTTQPSSSATD